MRNTIGGAVNLPTITVQAPYGSLIAEGKKTVETRSWPTKHRGRIGIHQGKAWAPGWRGWLDADDWRINALDDIGADLNEDVSGSGSYRVDRYTLPLGALVATAELVDVVPIVGDEVNPHERYPCLVSSVGSGDFPDGWLELYHPKLGSVLDPDGSGRSIPHEAPFGDYEPGRFAWLLDDVRPTTERCPACWGEGLPPIRFTNDQRTPEQQAAMDAAKAANGYPPECVTCDGAGTCPPVPARGKERFWRWTP